MVNISDASISATAGPLCVFESNGTLQLVLESEDELQSRILFLTCGRRDKLTDLELTPGTVYILYRRYTDVLCRVEDFTTDIGST